MIYNKNPEDIKYRIINVTRSDVPEFVSFSKKEEKDGVEVRGAVLEVLKADGSTKIVYDGQRYDIRYGIYENKFYIPKSLSPARLWVRAIDGTGIWYKVPMQLETQDDRAYILMAGGTKHLELCGDEYFEAMYRLIRT